MFLPNKVYTAPTAAHKWRWNANILLILHFFRNLTPHLLWQLCLFYLGVFYRQIPYHKGHTAQIAMPAILLPYCHLPALPSGPWRIISLLSKLHVSEKEQVILTLHKGKNSPIQWLPATFYTRKVSLPFTYTKSEIISIEFTQSERNSIHTKFALNEQNWIQNTDFVQRKRKTVFFPRHKDCAWLEARNCFCTSSFQKEKLFTSTNRALLQPGPSQEWKQGWKRGSTVKLPGVAGFPCRTSLPAQQCSRARRELDSSLFPGHHLAEPQDFSCHLASVPASSCSTTQVLQLFFLSSMNFSWGLQGLLQQVRHFH